MYDPKKDFEEMTERIEAICRERGITHNELAKKAGISNSTLSYFLSGKTTPYLYTLLQICDALEVLPQEIVGKGRNKQKVREEMYGAAEAFDMDKMSEKYRNFNEKQKILLELFIEALEQTPKC